MRHPARLSVLGLSLLAVGCMRQHYRERADRDVEGIITQKNVFPDWAVKNWHAYPHPDARYADPSNPDRPPYPPDDYAARVLSPNPQHPTKKSGAGRFEGGGYLDILGTWDAANRAGDAPPAKAVPEPKAGARALPGTLVPKTPVVSRVESSRPDTGKQTASRADVPAPDVRSRRPDPTYKADAAAPPPGFRTLDPTAKPKPGPTVTETRDAGLIVVAGEMDDGGKTVPAVVIVPTAQQPEKLPEPVQRSTTPKSDLPVIPQVGPPAPKAETPKVDAPKADAPKADAPKADAPKGDTVGFVATGDAAASVLKVLESQQQGYRIKLEQAVELGILNSREFQDRREDLYLAALPVSLQRFSFAAQGFFTEQAALNFAGKLTGTVPSDAANFGTTTGFNKLFPTGALLAVKLANQVVVDLTGDRPATTVSNFSLSLAQPFLRGGGYAVTLEPLTLAERNMVYAIRSYARFRKLFYVAVAAGGGYTNNPYGLQGLSVDLGRGVGNNLTAPSVGYLPLLLQAAVIANQKQNVDSLEQLLRLYEAFREGGQQSDLQVGQVEIQLLGGRNTLLGSSSANTGGGGGGGGGGGLRAYIDSLDSFKLQLGLPMTVGLDLDATPLGPIRKQLGRFEAVYSDLRDAEVDARKIDPAAPAGEFRPRWKRLLTQSKLVAGTEFAAGFPNRWAAWGRLTPDDAAKKRTALLDERRKLLDARADRQKAKAADPEAETARLNAVEAELGLAEFERAVRAYEAQPWAPLAGPARQAAQAAAVRDVLNAFDQLILDARNERLARIRREWPDLPGIDLDGTDLVTAPIDDAYTAAIQIALTRRLDLMNARGQVVDAWRQIKVTANALQGVLDAQYNLGSATPAGGANPAAFSGSRTTNNVTIRAELPLVRRAERNNYRAALIGYQRQRRTLQAFEDNIANDVRADVRELRTIAELYRVQQRLVELAYSQVDNAQAILLQPPIPGAQNDAGSAAALTQQVLQAQQNLLGAQNNLYTIWVSYLVSRMVMYADTELLQVDESGGWNDESLPGRELPGGPADAPAAGPRAERLPPPRGAAPAGR